jgi:TRAP transporter TAXI family solute receptor
MLRALLFAASFALAAPAGAIDLRLFTVGSGEVSGSYFAATNAICDSVNRAHRGVLRCSPEATPGTLYNLEALRDHQLDFALVQSDWQKAAYAGTGTFAASGPMTDLRSVMSLYPEALTILARPEAGITRLADLKDKRVDIGPPASGRRATVASILEAIELPETYFAALAELPTGSSIDELCAGRIDASILIVGHPNAAVARALRVCGATLVAVQGPLVDPVFARHPEYVPVVIPQSTYPELTQKVSTYSVIATVVTRADIAPDLVEALVASTLTDLRGIAMRAPVLAGLDPAVMRGRGLSAPVHPGALAAFDAFASGTAKP